MRYPPSLAAIFLAVMMLSVFAPAARAQLAQDQVLVVYDSRINESRLVAEHYAGSAKVPGGIGGKPGARPCVRVVDLAAINAPQVLNYEVNYATFKASYRDPLRAWLNANDAFGRIRVLVLTKGIPHRVKDINSDNIGDDPLHFIPEFTAGDITSSSLDSELTVLQQDLDANEAGAGGDSYADGILLNPFQNASQPISAWPTRSRTAAKAFDNAVTGQQPGIVWKSKGLPVTRQFLPADIYLVCRLDGNSLADIFAMIDRARLNYVNPNASVFILDESRSNGLADSAPNDEIDNDDVTTTPVLRLGDDYESTRDNLIADRRWSSGNIVYNAGAAPAGFVVGPRISFGGGLVESRPVQLLASEGVNTAGTLPSPNAAHDLPLSLNWAPMGFYNTAESFNGRQFGGLGTLFNQSQAADALSIAGGATFAIGHVWEPLSLALPDNDVIVRRFFLGNFSFAEAAYASIPGLSWMQVVVGDPLATVQRATEDIDGNGRVNTDDLYAYERAGGADINRSGAADQADRTLLENSIRRQSNPADMANLQRP